MRRLSVASVIGLVFLAWVPSVSAQGVARGEIVVPTFNVFSVGTTISVPDRGGMVIGGAGDSSTTSTEFGPGFGRGFASRSSAAGASARVWIHDFQELEASLKKSPEGDQSVPLAGFAAGLRRYASAPPRTDERSDPRSDYGSRMSTSPDQHTPSKTEQAADLLKRGEDAEKRGKIKIARLYYQSAAALGATPSSPAARERLQRLPSF